MVRSVVDVRSSGGSHLPRHWPVVAVLAGVAILTATLVGALSDGLRSRGVTAPTNVTSTTSPTARTARLNTPAIQYSTPWPKTIILHSNATEGNVGALLAYSTAISPVATNLNRFGVRSCEDFVCWSLWTHVANQYVVERTSIGSPWRVASPSFSFGGVGGSLYMIDHVVAVSRDTVVAYGWDALYATTNGGRTWLGTLLPQATTVLSNAQLTVQREGSLLVGAMVPNGSDLPMRNEGVYYTASVDNPDLWTLRR
jgi:hypothetical protein